MRRTRTIAFLSLATLTLSFLSAPSGSAATANAKCAKAGQSTKIGGKNYVCAQNPTLKSKTLRWTLKTCLSANTSYLQSVKALAEAETSNSSILEALDIQIRSLEGQIPIDEARATDELEKAKRSRDLATRYANEAAAKLPSVQSAGIQVVPQSWISDYATLLTILARDNRKATKIDLETLARRWNISVANQLAPVIQYLAAKSQELNYLERAANNEKAAAAWGLTASTLEKAREQRVKTAANQQELVKIAQDESKKALERRNRVCSTLR